MGSGTPDHLVQCPEAPTRPRRKEEAGETHPLQEKLKILSIPLAVWCLKRGCVPHILPGSWCLGVSLRVINCYDWFRFCCGSSQKSLQVFNQATRTRRTPWWSLGARLGRNAQCGMGDPSVMCPHSSDTECSSVPVPVLVLYPVLSKILFGKKSLMLNRKFPNNGNGQYV